MLSPGAKSRERNERKISRRGELANGKKRAMRDSETMNESRERERARERGVESARK